ncbi:MAG: hypothetical protein AMXMBFR58_35200 [Phycisphaerae bacterium]|nr:hypothetical protein [Phycisphaerales bacterium]MCK6477579.1 PEP-CTERM sorting domain-containing protein [Phycisphaerales bacterium]
MLKTRLLIAAAGIAACGAVATADIDVTVDSSATWYGYMNVFELPSNGGGYLWGSPWGLADLPASFTGDVLRLGPNTNTYQPGDLYWVNPDGSGNKWMNANIYGESNAIINETVNFSGHTLLNSLVSGYESRAFIKVLDPSQGWATILSVFAPLSTGNDFNLSLAIPNTAGLFTQWGFETNGANANPATVDQLGHVEVGPIPAPASLALVGLGGLVAGRRRR